MSWRAARASRRDTFDAPGALDAAASGERPLLKSNGTDRFWRDGGPDEDDSERSSLGGIPDYGRGDAALAIYPVTAASILPPAPSPSLEYSVYVPRDGTYAVTLVLGPVMDFVPDRGMRIAVSFDNEEPQVLDLFANRDTERFLSRERANQVTRNNTRFLRSSHKLNTPGPHALKIAMVDPGSVVQKIIISDRPLPESYFGPPDCALAVKRRGERFRPQVAGSLREFTITARG